MIFSNDSLDPADWQLLDQIAAAITRHAGMHTIKVRPLPGWPFAWLLHPGLTDGLTVADATSLFRLEEAGLIDIEQRSGARRAGQEILLTDHGKAAFKRRVYPGGHDGTAALQGDFSKRRDGGA